MPILNDALPIHATGHLFQHIGHEDSCSPKSRLSMTNLRISNKVPPDHFFGLWCFFHSLTSLTVQVSRDPAGSCKPCPCLFRRASSPRETSLPANARDPSLNSFPARRFARASASACRDLSPNLQTMRAASAFLREKQSRRCSRRSS